MVPLPRFKSITPPGAILDNAAATTAEVDCQDADYIIVTAYFGATDIAAAVLKLQASDTSGSGFTDISGSDLASSATATIDGTAIRWYIDRRKTMGNKRYLDLLFTAGDGSAGTYFTAFADLYRLNSTPTSNAELNVTASAFL